MNRHAEAALALPYPLLPLTGLVLALPVADFVSSGLALALPVAGFVSTGLALALPVAGFVSTRGARLSRLCVATQRVDTSCRVA